MFGRMKALIRATIATVVFLTIIPRLILASNITPNNKIKVCGDDLPVALTIVCNPLPIIQTNSTGKRSGNPFLWYIFKRLQMIKHKDEDEVMMDNWNGSNDKKEAIRWVIFTHAKRSANKRLVANECCQKSCTYRQFIMYCDNYHELTNEIIHRNINYLHTSTTAAPTPSTTTTRVHGTIATDSPLLYDDFFQ